MSMLSAQCDKLRSMAVSVGLAMPQAATMMMGAADTITELRDMVQDLQSENSKLRELVDEIYPLADYGAIDASELDRAHDLMRELGIEVDDG